MTLPALGAGQRHQAKRVVASSSEPRGMARIKAGKYQEDQAYKHSTLAYQLPTTSVPRVGKVLCVTLDSVARENNLTGRSLSP